MMWGYGYGPMMGYGGFGLLNMLFSVFWVVILVVFIIAAIRFVRGKSAWRFRSMHTALDILKERYARGELSKEEFEAMKKDIAA